MSSGLFPNLDAEGRNLSQADAWDLLKKFGNNFETEEESPCQSHYGAECQNSMVAPAVGFEPTTQWLTATRSTAELRRISPGGEYAYYFVFVQVDNLKNETNFDIV